MGSTPATQVSTALRHQTQRQVRADTVDVGQIDADQLIEQGAYVEVERIRLSRAVTWFGEWLAGRGFCWESRCRLWAIC